MNVLGKNHVAAYAGLWLALLLGSPAAAKEVRAKLCGHIELITPHQAHMTDMEKRLACGDDKNKPWADVPANQARLFLTSFLQGRGYYHPKFRMDQEHMVVESGDPTLVSTLEAQGAPPEFDLARYWQPPGKPLTPKILNDLEDWVRGDLRATGYPCPTVTSAANSDTGAVVVTIATGPRQDIIAIEEDPVPGVHPGIMRRNDAFHIGDLFNNDWLGLTASRITSKDLLLSTHFLSRCTAEGAVVTQKAIPGLPRQATAGVGYNTERGPLLRAKFRNSRLDSTASDYSLDLQLARRLQNFTAKGEWYLLPFATRNYLQPLLRLEHASESAFDTRSAKVRLAPAGSFDTAYYGGTFALGPAVEWVQTKRGVGPRNLRIASLDGEARLTTHAFEYFRQAPREGFELGLATTLTLRELGSQIDFQRFVLDWQALFNVRNLAPPLIVLGTRGSVATTVTGSRLENFAALPPNYRHYLGSSNNLRGFARQALPTGGLGALTTAYVGVEARLAAGIPYDIQPLVFYDVGKTGRQSLHFDRPLYESPGLGLRWQSPIGAVRATAARGIVRNAAASERGGLERWVFYFSFGEEF